MPIESLATELTLFILRIGIVAGLYLFCGWVVVTVARDALRDPAERAAAARAARRFDLVVVVGPEADSASPSAPDPAAERARPLKGHRFSIADGTTVGRDPESTIVLPDEYVSARHARFVWQNGRVWLEDLGSTNGTRVNGHLIRRPVQIGPGDLVEFGRYGFRVTPGSTDQVA